MKVTVMGLGYVGLVSSVALADAGHDVVGLDINAERIKTLRNKQAPFYEPGMEAILKKGLESGRLRFHAVGEDSVPLGEIVIIAVGTPSLPNGAADLAHVRSSIRWVAENATEPITLVMKSTVPPGTGQQMLAQYLRETTSKIAYVSNPEFLREGNAMSDWFYPDRIVIGTQDTTALEQTKRLYSNIKAPVVATDVTTAEMIKYAANAFLATKISFINEMASLCDRIGGNINDVEEGIALDPRIGPHFLKAGLGYGGSCFPKDVRGLEFISTMHDHSFELMKAVISVNNRQRMRPIQALKRVLGSLHGKAISVLGLAFKPDTDDIREAPSIDIIGFLHAAGAIIKVYDPIVDTKGHAFLPKEVKIAASAQDAICGAEAVILATEWKEFVEGIDWPVVYQSMLPPRFIFDGRNALNAAALKAIGFHYQGVGRS